MNPTLPPAQIPTQVRNTNTRELDNTEMVISGKAHDQMHQTLSLAARHGYPSIACEGCGVLSGAVGPIDTRQVEAKLKAMAELETPDDWITPIQPHRRYLYPEFPKDWTDKTFHTLEVDDENRDAVTVGKQWASQPGGVLVLNGPTGVGKTHLLAAIAQRIQANGRDVSAWEFDRWINTLRDVFAAEGRDEVKAFESRMLNVDVLVLDEIPAERTSDAIRTTFEMVVNRRTADRKPMLISTNATEENWSEWSQRAYSRLRARDYATWIPMIGRDRRLAA